LNFQLTLQVLILGSKDRDVNLVSADFFDVENHPTMTFRSTNIKKTDDSEYNVTGNLTLRGTTKSETFAVTYEGQGKDPRGNEKVGFSAF
jgi:polyisoprenoid-binding protein YceI